MGETLGTLLRKARESKGPIWTLDYVSRQIGRPGTWLSNLETGKTKGLPEPSELRRLADILGLTMIEVMQAAGFLIPDDLAQERINPFDMSDPRWHYVETLKRFDLSRPEHAGILVAVAQLLQLLDAPPETFALMREVVLGTENA